MIVFKNINAFREAELQQNSKKKIELMSVHKTKATRRKIKSAQRETNCRALKHKESSLPRAQAFFGACALAETRLLNTAC